MMYRVESVRFASIDECGSGRLELVTHDFRVLKTTPRGAWIDLGAYGRRFVRSDAKRRYAHPTEAEAMAAFIARKKRQIQILTAQLADARAALAIAEEKA